MKINILLLTSILPLVFASCGDDVKLELNQPITHYDKFENTTSLSGETFEFEEITPESVFTMDTFVVLSTPILIAPPHIAPFYIYSKNNFKEPLGKLGSKGRGPLEFINTPLVKQSYVDSIGDMHIWLENYNISFTDFNLSASLRQNQTIMSKNIEYDTFLEKTFDHMVINDSILLSKYSEPNKGLAPIYYFYNINSQQVLDSIDLYKYNVGITRENQLLATVHSIKPDRSKAVFTMIHFNVIHIVDLKTGEVKSISVGEEKELTDANMAVRNFNYYYAGSATTDDYIFAIYRGVSKSLFKLTPAFKLQIFDWEGRPLHEIELDSRARYISVDPKTNTLYGVDPDEGTLHKYELDEVLKNTRTAK